MVSHSQYNKLSKGSIASIIYHDIFDFPLTHQELVRWKYGKSVKGKVPQVVFKNGYYSLKNKTNYVRERKSREYYSNKKMQQAKIASNILSYIPTVKLVAVSGSLAMQNAKKDSDIDLMVITKDGWMWTTRLLSLLLLSISGLSIRKAFDNKQKDRLCLNVWMSGVQAWDRKRRNAYTAHEIAQLVPLTNKNKCFEKFLSKNFWIYSYWPNAHPTVEKTKDSKIKPKTNLVEKVFYYIQYWYMRRKITNEIVNENLALFHPYDWSFTVLSKFYGQRTLDKNKKSLLK